jgi:hypothetical protein
MMPDAKLADADLVKVDENAEYMAQLRAAQPDHHDTFRAARIEGNPHDGPQRVAGVSNLAAVFEFENANPDHRLLLAGHSDTTGEDDFNFTLSDERARNVLALLLGERERWIDICFARHPTAHNEILKADPKAQPKPKLVLSLTLRLWSHKFFRKAVRHIVRDAGDTFNLARPNNVIEGSFVHKLTGPEQAKITYLPEQLELKDVDCEASRTRQPSARPADPGPAARDDPGHGAGRQSAGGMADRRHRRSLSSGRRSRTGGRRPSVTSWP